MGAGEGKQEWSGLFFFFFFNLKSGPANEIMRAECFGHPALGLSTSAASTEEALFFFLNTRALAAAMSSSPGRKTGEKEEKKKEEEEGSAYCLAEAGEALLGFHRLKMSLKWVFG